MTWQELQNWGVDDQAMSFGAAAPRRIPPPTTTTPAINSIFLRVTRKILFRCNVYSLPGHSGNQTPNKVQPLIASRAFFCQVFSKMTIFCRTK
jgi:hypothetical protein